MSVWPQKKIRDLGKVITGATPSTAKGEFWGGDIPFVTPSDLDSQAPILECPRTLTEAALKDKLKIVKKDSVLVCCIGSLGKTGIAGRALATNQQINAVEFDSSKVWPNFGLYACRLLKAKLISMAPATTVPIVSKSKFENLEISVPPIVEQRRIADILDRTEALRAKRRAALVKLDELSLATFVKMFGNLSSNPMNWEIESVSSLLTGGPQNGIYKPSHLYGRGTPILRIDAFYDGVVTDLNSLKRVELSDDERTIFGLQEGDVVINRVNSIEYLGKCALIPELNEPTVFESNMMRLSLDTTKVVPVFFTRVLQSECVKRQILRGAKQAVNQASINQQDVLGFQVPLPPLWLQQEFASRVQALDRLKAKQRQSLSGMDDLFMALQHLAFQGKL